MKEDRTKQVILYSILLTIGVFIFDLLTPLGVAGGVPYAAVVLISFYLPRRRHTVIAGIVGSILTILGFFLSPPAPSNVELWIVLINRSLALFVIWSGVIFVTKYKQAIEERRKAEDALEQANKDLKRYTDELKRSNSELEQFAYVVIFTRKAGHFVKFKLHSAASHILQDFYSPVQNASSCDYRIPQYIRKS